MREALLGAGGALSAGANAATRNLAEIGAVVQGVNDQQAEAAGGGDGAAADPAQTYPMSPTAIADQRSREARYGVAAAPTGEVARVMASAEAGGPAAAHPGARPRAFDASEGTPLDPLLNTTWDLTYPKTVPSLK